MSTEEQTPPPLLLPKKEYVGEAAFDGDQLNRKELGDRLSTYLDRLRRGAVIAIDAPWGEGKTWFGKNWEKSLKDGGYKVAFIDAFEQDYIEDPFLLIAAELMTLLEEEQDTSDLRGQAISVMKALVPVTAKAVMNLAGRTVIGTTDLEGDLKSVAEELLSGTTDLSAQWIDNRLNDYQQEKESFSAFRETISQLAVESDKPIVIIVDELDRCKPSFAVSLIERLKHFFDVPNLIFILLMNKKQLESAVSGVYGEGTDSHAYLGKFINLTLSLPKKRKLDYPGEDHIKQYCNHVFAQYEFGNNDHHRAFLDTFSLMANLVNLSLRDIEKGISWYAFTHPNKAATWLLSYIIILKLTKPELVSGILNGTPESHNECRKIVEKMIEKIGSEHGMSRYLTELDLLHSVHLGEEHNKDELQGIRQSIARYALEIERLFPFLATKTELQP